MLNFFIEGGVLMWPILVLGLVTVGSAARYLVDGEPVRLRFIALVSLALLVTIALATVMDVGKVVSFAYRLPPAETTKMVLAGLAESSRPAALGLGLLGLALDLVVIGAYRVGRRELRAARG
jgi:hypothetical protein